MSQEYPLITGMPGPRDLWALWKTDARWAKILEIRRTGRFAQITLAPGTSTTHPSHGGILGDLYVDLNARLWFCRGANNWVQVV